MATALEKLELKKANLQKQYEALQQEKQKINKEKVKLARKTRSGELVAMGILLETYLLTCDEDGTAYAFLQNVAQKKLTRTVDKERAIAGLEKVMAKKQQLPQ